MELMEKGWEPEFSPLTLSWLLLGPPLQVLESKASLLMEPVVEPTRAPEGGRGFLQSSGSARCLSWSSSCSL